MLRSEPSNELKYRNEDSQSAFDIYDEMERTDVGSRVERSVEGRFPKHEEECIQLESNCGHEEQISELSPIIHAMFEVQKRKGKCEVKGSFQIGEGRDRRVARPDEDAVEDDDGYLEDKNVVAHGRL